MRHHGKRKPYTVVELTGDTEPMFTHFDTVKEAEDYASTVSYKHWIIGPDYIEDHS